MRVIFCASPLNNLLPDFMYEQEVEAAVKVNFDLSVINFEALVDEGDIARSLRRVTPADEAETAIYRGWMMKPDVYEQLYHGLAERNILLINTPAAYRHCHYFPESYPVIEGHTPRSVWMKVNGEVSIDAIMELLRPFDNKPVILKDYVKSRKHEWTEACFIPSAADRQAVERVVSNFLKLQGDDLNEGLVFREFVEFEPLGFHPASNMPLTTEYRLFYLDGKLIASAPYWDEDDYKEADKPPVKRFNEIAKHVQSRFFTMDVAQRKDGNWMIMELGDGQVAGLPERVNVRKFYQQIAIILNQAMKKG
ncbi:MAG TPA: ATP-grasp domain-containing protein [Ktedonobacteraceae bacterium]|jgi:hypothetical protein|nr:ATP-grasp domain-containing protein [Ktedonobacteraceae bacterium]